MKLAVTYPDPERAAVDLIEVLLAEQDEEATVGIGVPDGWTKTSGNHVQVSWDGTPETRHPVLEHPTLRIVIWSATPTEAKRLANLARGLLLAHIGGALRGIKPLIGIQPDRDPDTRAELAWFTVRATVRSTVIT